MFDDDRQGVNGMMSVSMLTHDHVAGGLCTRGVVCLVAANIS